MLLLLIFFIFYEIEKKTNINWRTGRYFHRPTCQLRSDSVVMEVSVVKKKMRKRASDDDDTNKNSNNKNEKNNKKKNRKNSSKRNFRKSFKKDKQHSRTHENSSDKNTEYNQDNNNNYFYNNILPYTFVLPIRITLLNHPPSLNLPDVIIMAPASHLFISDDVISTLDHDSLISDVTYKVEKVNKQVYGEERSGLRSGAFFFTVWNRPYNYYLNKLTNNYYSTAFTNSAYDANYYYNYNNKINNYNQQYSTDNKNNHNTENDYNIVDTFSHTQLLNQQVAIINTASMSLFSASFLITPSDSLLNGSSKV